MTTTVNGSVTVQYTQKRSPRTLCPAPAFQLKRGMEKKEETQVAGRKAVVRTAMVFMEALSRRLAAAMDLESLAISMLRMRSFCAMRL